MMQFSIAQNMLICELGVKKQEGREPDAHQNGHATRHDSLSKIILHGTLDTAPWTRHLGRWATPRTVEEIMDVRHKRVDISAHSRTAHNGLLKKRLEQDLC